MLRDTTSAAGAALARFKFSRPRALPTSRVAQSVQDVEGVRSASNRATTGDLHSNTSETGALRKRTGEGERLAMVYLKRAEAFTMQEGNIHRVFQGRVEGEGSENNERLEA